jgi:hypothetical protein
MKKVKVKATELGDLYLDLYDIVPMELVYTVETYTIEEIDDDGVVKLILTLFDKDGNIINVEVTDEVF